MAKTRVSHLAKEFNLDVKELILRLREINIEVDNYLSSIESTEVARAREMLAKTVPLVEEQRVGTHIKRRRATARPKPVTEKPTGPAFSPDDMPETVPTQDAEAGSPSSPPAEAAPVSGKSGKPMVSPSETAQGGGKAGQNYRPARNSQTGSGRCRQTSTGHRSHTTGRGCSRNPGPPFSGLPETGEVPPEGVLTPPSSQGPVEPPLESGAPPEAGEIAGATVSTETTQAPMEAKTPDTSTALKRQKAKKAKKDTPARIISLPVPGEKIEPEATRPAPVSPAAPARRPPRVIEVVKTREEKPAPVPEKDDKKAKVKRKRAKKPGTAEDDAKKKGFRKKEIREGAELYAGKEAEGGAAAKKKGVKKGVRKMGKTELTVPKAIKRRIKVGDSITVGELAKKMGIKFSDLAKKLMALGIMANINQPLDYDSAVLVATSSGMKPSGPSSWKKILWDYRPRKKGNSKNAHRWLPSWGMLIMGKPPCWTPSGKAASSTVRPAALPSISAPIMSRLIMGTSSS